MINPDPKMIAQLNLLSDLLGNPGGDSSRGGLVKLTLFDEEDDDDVVSRSVCFHMLGSILSCFSRPPAHSQAASSSKTSRARNDDITIDVSKVRLSECQSIEMDRVFIFLLLLA